MTPIANTQSSLIDGLEASTGIALTPPNIRRYTIQHLTPMLLQNKGSQLVPVSKVGWREKSWSQIHEAHQSLAVS